MGEILGYKSLANCAGIPIRFCQEEWDYKSGSDTLPLSSLCLISRREALVTSEYS